MSLVFWHPRRVENAVLTTNFILTSPHDFLVPGVKKRLRFCRLPQSPTEAWRFYFFRLNLDLDLNFADPFLAPLLSRLLGSNSVNLYLHNGGQSDTSMSNNGGAGPAATNTTDFSKAPKQKMRSHYMATPAAGQKFSLQENMLARTGNDSRVPSQHNILRVCNMLDKGRRQICSEFVFSKTNLAYQIVQDA